MWRFPSCCVLALLGACAATSGTETVAFDTDEGTTLAFDLSPADGAIVFDLLGQLWSVPGHGGEARPLTDAVADTAEDLDPSISPDGRSVVFRGERGGRRGLWLLDLATGDVRQLTQIEHADGHHGAAAWSPDGRAIAFTRIAPDSGGTWHSRIALLDVAGDGVRDLEIDAGGERGARDPAWTPDGRSVAFVAASPADPRGGRVWVVDAAGGSASAISGEGSLALAPAFAPDGARLAFLAPDSADRLQVWVQRIDGGRAGRPTATGAPTRLTDHLDVASTRVRWAAGGVALVYAADGKLRRVSVDGAPPTIVPFTAHVSLVRDRVRLPPARLVAPGADAPARGFLGLALAPDGERIAMLALGRLWIVGLDGAARAVADVPFTARGLAWSADGREVVWSGGPFGAEDLFVTDVATGETRRLTALPGREVGPAYSPDGRRVAFLHQDGAGALRVVDADAPGPVTDPASTLDLGPAEVPWAPALDVGPAWSPASDALLVVGEADPGTSTTAVLARLGGARDTVRAFVDAPAFLRWDRTGSLTFARHDRLWRVPFDGRAPGGDPEALGDDAAIYASVSGDGTVLYVSADGLRVRGRSGEVRTVGWPVAYTSPSPPPLLIRNARVVDGIGGAAGRPTDILVEGGRIRRTAAGGTIRGVDRVIDATGRFVMPGLVDLHAHTYRPDLLPAFLYFGVTTVRDQGSAMAPLAAYADGVAAGVIEGPRLAYGGFQLYTDWPLDDEQGRGLEPEADPGHVARAVALEEALGGQHVKTRTFRRWDIVARAVREAHRRGLRATGHCAAALPLVAAGIDAKEHSGLCSTRGTTSPYALNDVTVYGDVVGLYRAAGVAVVPTIVYFGVAARVDSAFLASDPELAPFVSADDFDWMLGQDADARARVRRAALQAREATAKLVRAGVTVGTGTDLWQLPTGVHLELEELVASGLSPADAIGAATSAAARVLGAGDVLGAVEPGKWADLVILDADPLADIRNTRRIHAVIQGGRVVDRAVLRDRATGWRQPPVG